MKITFCQVSFTVSEMLVVHFSTPLVSNGEGTANQALGLYLGTGVREEVRENNLFWQYT